MSDLSIQFHALPRELLDIIQSSVDDLGLLLFGVSDEPFALRQLDGEEIEAAVTGRLFDRFVFYEQPVVGTVHSAAELADKMPGALYLEIGAEGPKWLGESWLASRALESPLNPKWKKVAAKLRGITSAGAVAVSPATGATSTLRSHRFSAGATDLYHKGVQMLPVAGSSSLRPASANGERSRE